MRLARSPKEVLKIAHDALKDGIEESRYITGVGKEDIYLHLLEDITTVLGQS